MRSTKTETRFCGSTGRGLVLLRAEARRRRPAWGRPRTGSRAPRRRSALSWRGMGCSSGPPRALRAGASAQPAWCCWAVRVPWRWACGPPPYSQPLCFFPSLAAAVSYPCAAGAPGTRRGDRSAGQCHTRERAHRLGTVGQAARGLARGLPQGRGAPEPTLLHVGLGDLRGSFWANVRLLSSWHSPQAALKCSCCSDRVTRD